MASRITPGWMAISLLVLAMAAPVCAFAAAEKVPNPCVAQAQAFGRCLQQRDFAGAVGMFDPALAKAMDARQLEAAWDGATQRLGRFCEVLDAIIIEEQPVTVVLCCRFDSGLMDLKTRFAPDGRIMTFFLGEHESETPIAAAGTAGDNKNVRVGPWAMGLAVVALAGAVVAAAASSRRNRMLPKPMEAFDAVVPHFLGLGTLFLLCMVLGLIVCAGSTARVSQGPEMSQQQQMALEQVFGPLRDSLRNGSASAIALVALIVLGANVMGNVVCYTLPGIPILPGAVLIGWMGWSEGMTVWTLKGSSAGSVAGYLAVMWLEALTYVLAAAAGTRAGTAVLMPRALGEVSRRQAFVRACKGALRVYVVIVAVLVVQAFLEAFYVRQVLLHGGSGIPLQPY